MHDVYTINIMQLSKYTTQHPLGMQEILVSVIIDMTQRGVSFCHCDCLSIVFAYNTADCTLSVTHNVSGKNMFNKMHIYAIPGTCFFFFFFLRAGMVLFAKVSDSALHVTQTAVLCL